MQETTVKTLGIAASAAVGLGGIAFSIWDLSVTREFEARRPFLERQMELCFDASRAAARLAASEDEALREAALARFRELYWGELAVVEDRAVEAAMVRFKRELDAAGPGGGRLPVLALNVAHACRELTLDSWDIRLPPLEGMREG